MSAHIFTTFSEQQQEIISRAIDDGCYDKATTIAHLISESQQYPDWSDVFASIKDKIESITDQQFADLADSSRRCRT